jgi:PiT family inorganic phosphate transporter
MMMDQMTIYLILAGVFGLFMAWGIGANDVANAMATSVGSGALKIKQAVVLAAIFEFAGAYLAGGEVTKTIRKGIVEADAFNADPNLLIWGMLAALLAAGTWLAIASRKGWPVSTTHSIVGAVVGFAAVGIGMDAVNWGKVGTIVMSWVVSPLLAGTLAFIVFRSIQKLILNTENPVESAIKYGPYYLFLVGFVIALVTIKKGLKHVGLELGAGEAFVYAAVLGVVVAMLGSFLIRKVKTDPKADKNFNYTNVVISTAQTGMIASKSALPAWVLLVGGIGIVIGLATFGYKVIATVGKKITELTPSRGFAAEIAAAGTVVLASFTGIPISTTHTLVGAVLGVGFARGIGAIDMRVVGNIFMSWVVTLPAGGLLAIIFFFMFKGIFS